MKRVLLITSAMLLVLAFSSFATDTRVMTMGENNNIMLDEANIWLYPSRINYYPDLAAMELAHQDDEEGSPIERVGVNFKFGDDKPWVLGLYLHNASRFNNSFSPITGAYHGPYYASYLDLGDASSSNRRLDLFYGRKLGENDFGWHLGYTHSSEEGFAATNYDERSFSQVNLDFGLTMKDGLLDIAAGWEGFSFVDRDSRNRSDTIPVDWYGADDKEDKGNSSFYLRARYFHELNPTSTIVPHVGFRSGKYKYIDWDWNFGTLENEVDDRFQDELTEFNLGVGLHYTPASKVLTVLDVGLSTSKITRKIQSDDTQPPTESSEKYVALPYFKLGFEASVFRWLDVRFGAESYWTKYTNENVTGQAKVIKKYPENRNYLGLGFHWGKFHIDSYVDPELFLNGFDFVAGNGSGNMNMAISAVYEMH